LHQWQGGNQCRDKEGGSERRKYIKSKEQAVEHAMVKISIIAPLNTISTKPCPKNSLIRSQILPETAAVVTHIDPCSIFVLLSVHIVMIVS
jgi:hypothetical protein